MTKQNPLQLCPKCQILNDEFQEKAATIDVLVVCNHEEEKKDITHWMPLPRPPEDKP